MQALSLLSLACTRALPREQHHRSLLRDHWFAQSSSPMSQSKGAAALLARALVPDAARDWLGPATTAREVVVVPVRVVVVVLPGHEERLKSKSKSCPHFRLSWRQHQSS